MGRGGGNPKLKNELCIAWNPMQITTTAIIFELLLCLNVTPACTLVMNVLSKH